MELIVALDVDTLSEAEKIINLLKHKVDVFKVGSRLFTSVGPAILNLLNSNDCKIFLDLKYHDIPTVISDAVRAAYDNKVFAVSLHIAGGREMLEKCVSLKNKPLLWGITVLTSFDENDLKELGVCRKIEEQVLHLAKIAKSIGLDGVVCSPGEIEIVKKLGSLKIIIPGIRFTPLEVRSVNTSTSRSSGLILAGHVETTDDQKRTLTPKEAKEKNADYIVVGRPIIKADNPLAVTEKILEEIK